MRHDIRYGRTSNRIKEEEDEKLAKLRSFASIHMKTNSIHSSGKTNIRSSSSNNNNNGWKQKSI